MVVSSISACAVFWMHSKESVWFRSTVKIRIRVPPSCSHHLRLLLSMELGRLPLSCVLARGGDKRRPDVFVPEGDSTEHTPPRVTKFCSGISGCCVCLVQLHSRSGARTFTQSRRL